jgi:hypothetical protein
MAVDFSDVGNLILVSAGFVATFVTSLGYTKEALVVGAVGLMVKGICSAIDNYIFKKANPVL